MFLLGFIRLENKENMEDAGHPQGETQTPARHCESPYEREGGSNPEPCVLVHGSGAVAPLPYLFPFYVFRFFVGPGGTSPGAFPVGQSPQARRHTGVHRG